MATGKHLIDNWLVNECYPYQHNAIKSVHSPLSGLLSPTLYLLRFYSAIIRFLEKGTLWEQDDAIPLAEN